MRLTWAAGLALLTAVALSGCGSDPADDAAVVPAAQSLSIEGDEFEVMLPSGQFAFTVTEPRDELSGVTRPTASPGRRRTDSTTSAWDGTGRGWRAARTRC